MVRHIELSLMTFACVLRACIVIASLGLMATGMNYCPTGQSICDMAGMDDTQNDGPTCVLACGVPLEQAAVFATSVSGQISTVPVPLTKSFVGVLTEPVVPPPRNVV
jgi:hypothetical protein